MIDAVLRNFEILGEAANRVSGDIRTLAPEVDWQRIKDFRNVIAHFYSGVDLPLTWIMVQQRVPTLLRSLDALRGQVPDG